ncbi:MAG: PqqD family protein [Candidatus Obscuribacterales bacterium]|nr:PqqD family protein [Candidatus Obscuribacterales bacterium]
MDDSSKIYPRRMEGIQSTLLPDGHVVLFDSRSDWAETLNPAAAIIWEYCDGQTSLAEMGSIIAEISKRPNSLDETKALIDELHNQGLIAFR